MRLKIDSVLRTLAQEPDGFPWLNAPKSFVKIAKKTGNSAVPGWKICQWIIHIEAPQSHSLYASVCSHIVVICHRLESSTVT